MLRNALTTVISYLKQFSKQFQVKQLLAVVLVGFVLTTIQATPTKDSQSLGKALRQRIEETDQTNRPKTTGEFLDEAAGDVPLDKRLHNITRDSKEAFKKLGDEYTPDVKQGVKDLRDNLFP